MKDFMAGGFSLLEASKSVRTFNILPQVLVDYHL
jgi:hypothetical protein